MDKPNLNKLLVSERACPSPTELLAYSKNNADINARKIELHIASCKLCSDAIEGFENAEFPIKNDVLKTRYLKKSSGFINSLIIATITCSILALIYFINNQSSIENVEVKKESGITQKDEIKLLNKEIENELVKIDSTNDANDSTEEIKVSIKNKVVLNPINKISINKISENKISDSVITRNSVAQKREFFKSAFPIKYVNELKAIDYQHLYENIEEKNIPVLKSLDPRYENLKSKSEVTDNSTELKLSYNEVLATALLAFSNGDFETCERYFTLILNTYPDDQNATFYRGISFYKQNRISQAIPLLEKLSQRVSSPFMEEAQWHLANCYKEENRIAEMKLILQKLIAKNGFYSEKAKVLMNQF